MSKADEEDITAYLDLAVAYLEMGLVGDAVDMVEHALKLEPDNERAKDIQRQIKSRTQPLRS